MRGSKRQRYEGSWTLIIDLGPGLDAKTGVFRKRRQQTETFVGNSKEADARLTELVRLVNRDQYVRPSKLTVREWLQGDWLRGLKQRIDRDIRATTVSLYERTITKHIAPSTLGHMRLQRVRPMDAEAYFHSLPLSTKSLDIHRSILLLAFKDAKRNRLIEGDNPIKESRRVQGDRALPSRQRAPSAWTAVEAQRFIAAATEAGSQPAALYSLALDSGARKGELLGLRWSDVDLDAGTITICQQLLSNGTKGSEPVFGPPKTGRERTVDVDVETLRLLSDHRKAQARIGGLVFTQGDGSPLPIKSIGPGEFARITEASGVRPIRFHDMRHTTATLLLLAGEQVHVVSRRLGHATVTQTMNTYAHVLNQQAKQAGRTIGALIHGGK